MPIRLELTADVPEVLDPGEYGPGAVMRVQSSADGLTLWADLAGTGATPTIAIAVGVETYIARDPSGTSTTYYRTRYENVGASRTSDWTAAFQPTEPSWDWVDGPALIAYVNGKSPQDDVYAAEVAAAANAAVDNVLEYGPTNAPSEAAIAEVTRAAFIIAAALWKRREAPNGLVPVVDLAGVAIRMANDPVAGVRPMLNRWHPTGGVGIG